MLESGGPELEVGDERDREPERAEGSGHRQGRDGAPRQEESEQPGGQRQPQEDAQHRHAPRGEQVARSR
jgi:hypothetical protein